jgi:hypothetical protein
MKFLQTNKRQNDNEKTQNQTLKKNENLKKVVAK